VCVCVWTGLNRLGIGTSGMFLNSVSSFGFHKGREIFSSAEWLLAFQQGLCFMELAALSRDNVRPISFVKGV
jgi:hypothetical protein